jgi:Nup93/Nic96
MLLKKYSFWLKACQDFDQWHFRGRRTLALEVIEAKNCLNLVNVFQILLKLFDFFDQFAIHEFKDALRIVESLDLIPKTKEETESKCNAFRISNQALKNIFPAVLEAYMDSLFQQYIHTINHDTNSDVLERNKQELKAKALLVTSFAARLQLPVQSRSRMSLVQAQII